MELKTPAQAEQLLDGVAMVPLGIDVQRHPQFLDEIVHQRFDRAIELAEVRSGGRVALQFFGLRGGQAELLDDGSADAVSAEAQMADP